jgi:hypothetical protein
MKTAPGPIPLSEYGNHDPKPISPALEAYLAWQAEKGETPPFLRWKIWKNMVLFEVSSQQSWEGFEAGFNAGLRSVLGRFL